MPSPHDTAVGVAVALVILAAYFLVWPAPARLRPAEVAGAWTTGAGRLVVLTARPGRALAVREVPRGGDAPAAAAAAELTGFAGIRMGGARGTVDLQARRIRWTGGTGWVRQGVH